MKFSEIKKDKWEELKPYFDTCLLPITGLTGGESPWEAAEALERLRDAMEALEKRYTGRMVTYPALHYTGSTDWHKQAAECCWRLKNHAGFRYVVLISADEAAGSSPIPEADLWIAGSGNVKEQAIHLVDQLWNDSSST